MADNEVDSEFERFMQESLSGSTTSAVDRRSFVAVKSGSSAPPHANPQPASSDKLWWLKDKNDGDDKQLKTTFLKKPEPQKGQEMQRTFIQEAEIGPEQHVHISPPLLQKIHLEERSEQLTLTIVGDSELIPSGDGDSTTMIDEYGEDFEEDVVTVGGEKNSLPSNDKDTPKDLSTRSDQSITNQHFSTLDGIRVQDETTNDSSTNGPKINASQTERPKPELRPTITKDDAEPSSSQVSLNKNVRSVDEILQEVEELERIIGTVQSSSNDNRLDVRVEESDEDIEHPGCERRVDLNSNQDHYRDSVSSGSRLDLINLQQLLHEERRRNSKIKAHSEGRERSMRRQLDQQKLDYEDRLVQLREENVRLGTKVQEGLKEDANTKDGLEEQERLLRGFETENRRLYDKVKSLEAALNESRAEILSQKRRPSFSDSACQVRKYPEEQQKHDDCSSTKPPQKTDDDSQKRTKVASSDEEHQSQPKARIDSLAMDNEVTMLKRRVMALENEVRQKNLENDSSARVIAAKDRTIDQSRKRMKQLESLLQVKNPNSISALVLASSVATNDGPDEESGARVVRLLEERVCDLERQLEVRMAKNGDESLIALQRQFDNVKVRYESKIHQLELRLTQAESTGTNAANRRPQTSISALEKELDNIRERHRTEVNALRKELEVARKETKRSNVTSKDSEKVASLITRNRYLVGQIEARDRAIQDLEFKSSIAAQEQMKANAGESLNKDNDKIAMLSKNLEMLRSELRTNKDQLEAANAALDEANEKLRNVTTSRRLEETEMDSQLGQVTKRCLELRRKSETQEVRNFHQTDPIIVENLRLQLSRALVKQDKMEAVSLENAALKSQCQELQEDLCHLEIQRTPEQRDFLSLQARVLLAERLYEEKSEALRRLASQRDQTAQRADGSSINVVAEVDMWKRKFYARNTELERFRSELDAIMQALEELQEQGLTVPTVGTLTTRTQRKGA